MEHLFAGPRPFRGSDAVRTGRTTPDLLRGPTFARVGCGLHIGAAIKVDVRVRTLATSLKGRGRGVVAGPLAALAWKAECPWDDAELILPTSRRLVSDGVRVRVDRLAPDEVAERFGVAITSPLRTAFDLARRHPLDEAVAAVDALCFKVGLTRDDLVAVAAAHPGARGLLQLREVIDLMEPLSESVKESQLRLGLVHRGVPRPVAQYEVTLPSGKDARLDLAWPRLPRRRPFALEYDGPEHRTIPGQNADKLRDAALDDIGWEVMHVSSRQVLDPREFDALAIRVRRRVDP